MEFYDVIEKRKSIKRFTTDFLDNGKIDRIIKAAMMAPSWKNNTSYKIILVDNDEERRALAQAVLNDDKSAASAIEVAPLTIIITADPAQSGNVNNKEYYLVDSAIAMEHIVLAATAEGYGTCWIGAVDEAKIRQIVNIPENYRVIAMTPVGMIEEKEEHYPKKNMGDFIFHNKWNTAITDTYKQ